MIACKNCRFWQPFKGNMHAPPATARHACTLYMQERSRTLEDGTVEFYKVPTNVPPGRNNGVEKGPRFGERTKPKDGCNDGVRKGGPIVNPKHENSAEDSARPAA